MSKKIEQNLGHAVSLDVDTRFLLANERTFLAWIRTALTIMAGGVALAQLGGDAMSVQFGMLAVLFGAITAVLGYMRYTAADQSIRRHELPMRGKGPVIQLVGIMAFAVGIVVVEFLL